MFKSILNAFKVKDLRKRLIFVFLMLVVIRFGSNLPIPGVNSEYFAQLFNSMANNDAFGWFNTMTGGSFEQLSVFALSITPYITSSIIIQLLTVAIPALEELQKDGEEGRKKLTEYTRYVTIGLALIESSAMAVGFGGQGLLIGYADASTVRKIADVAIAVITMTTGSALLMWIGEQITDKGIGNGISLVLLFNILSSVPNDFQTLYVRFIQGRNVATMVVAAIIIAACLIALVAFTVVLTDAERKIPVQYSRRVQGRGLVGGQSSSIPLKVNTASVMPVIFASSLMTMPVVIGQVLKVDYGTVLGQILRGLNSGSWCNPDAPIYSIGLIVYILLLYFFAYFYTSISFNPLEIANNMKKQGGFIPGIRPGKPTSDYLDSILTYIIFIGASGLAIVAIIPIFVSGVFNVGRISFAGTSLIIIIGVVLETLKAIESQMVVRNYKGFLND
ncbi:preprotein translocase subunit SecY [Oribacterium sp. WCC10]|uniref:preprotein translocase subunit SecY n=1 Tax=Oribacterium sp. WCC10 TaxID=1855343 RepID=UPI0008EB08C2|nr:preprotein translocase subunit SecY [Oribacterium sp. WCC10]SFG35678.1 protein translocase subunit secY/sec61 alpha [Oribacterium sp. WCC10]